MKPQSMLLLAIHFSISTLPFSTLLGCGGTTPLETTAFPSTTTTLSATAFDFGGNLVNTPSPTLSWS